VMILVTAAFGHQGRLLIPKLAAAGFRVRAWRATPGREAEMSALGAHETVTGDMSDPEVYARHLCGVDVVYHVGPAEHPREKEMGFAMVEAARRTKVRHVVMSSVLHTIIDILQHRIKRDIEEKLIESGVDFTILKPCDFMMTEVYILPVLHSNEFPVFWTLTDARKGSLIDLDDLTDVAFKVIKEGAPHYAASYELSGPDNLTSNDVADVLSKVTGRKITAVQRSVDDLFQAIHAMNPAKGLDQSMAVMKSIIAWYSKYSFVGNPNVFTWLMGRPPKSFEQFATAAYAAAKR